MLALSVMPQSSRAAVRFWEASPIVVICASWAFLAFSAVYHSPQLSIDGIAGAPTARVSESLIQATWTGLSVPWDESVGHWILMTVAMMGPASLGGVRYTASNS